MSPRMLAPKPRQPQCWRGFLSFRWRVYGMPMAKWFVFVDIEYYPFVESPRDWGDPRWIEADTAEEAIAHAVADGCTEGGTVYAAPADAVTVVEVPADEQFRGASLIELQSKLNAYMLDRLSHLR